MKITIFKIVPMLAAFIAGFSTAGCVSMNDEPVLVTPQEEEVGWNSCDMIFSAPAPAFDASTSRADAKWPNGAVVYINFEKADGTSTYGNAVYTLSTDSWKLNYDGRLSTGIECKCTLYYFAGSGFSANSLKTVITTDHNTEIYHGQGAYIYSDGAVNLNATLKPFTSRIKFNDQSNKATSFNLRGIDYVSQIDLPTLTAKIVNTGDYDESSSGISCTSSTSTTSKYIYGYFHEEPQSMGLNGLFIKVGGYVYSFDFPEDAKDFMKVGTSGYMTMPTSDSHSGWYLSESINKELTNWSTSSYSSNNKKDVEFAVVGKALFYVYFSSIDLPRYETTESTYNWFLKKSEATDYIFYHDFDGTNFNDTPSIYDYKNYGGGTYQLETGTYQFELQAAYWYSSGWAKIRNF